MRRAAKQPTSSELPLLIERTALRVRAWVELIPDDVRVYLSDRSLQERLALHLVLAMTACTAVAGEIARSRAQGRVLGLADLFGALHAEGLLSENLAAKLEQAARLRNQLLFDWDSVNVHTIFEASLTVPDSIVECLTALSGDHRRADR
jgi:uncharacterized protein YutE (UPF0331/DUF86 family)